MSRRISRFIAGRSLLSQLTARRLNAILDAIEETRPIAGRGLQMRQTSGGIVLDNTQKVGGGGVSVTGGAVSYPFDMTVVPNATTPETHVDVTFKPGLVGNILPSNIYGTLTTLNTGTFWVVINGTASSGSISTCSMGIAATAPGDSTLAVNAPPASFKIVVGLIVDGVAYNALRRSVAPYANIRYQVEKTGPIGPGEVAWDYYYAWAW